jgi:hypothetical protein
MFATGDRVLWIYGYPEVHIQAVEVTKYEPAVQMLRFKIGETPGMAPVDQFSRSQPETIHRFFGRDIRIAIKQDRPCAR